MQFFVVNEGGWIVLLLCQVGDVVGGNLRRLYGAATGWVSFTFLARDVLLKRSVVDRYNRNID